MTKDLPEVEHALPWALRLVVIVVGVLAILVPARELTGGLWPPSAIGLFFAIFLMGAAAVGVPFIRAGLSGEAQRWTYPPRTLLIHSRGLRTAWQTRLTARDIAAVEIRRIRYSEGADAWRVAVLPKDILAGARVRGRISQRQAAFEPGDFATSESADAARQALPTHLGMDNNGAGSFADD